MKRAPDSFGPVAFLGSGETSYAGGRLFESLAARLPKPLRIAVLETPAGFEVNSAQVAARVADFLRVRLQNYAPRVNVIPVRRRGTPFSPDEPAALEGMLDADLIFLGPGSPSYAVRQLQGSLAWDVLRARHHMGAALVFASAAAVAAGAYALPVYEIFKVGEDVHLKPGLGLFAAFGLDLSFVPHWNNAEGGADVDTSRCFIGHDRFEQWRGLLPAGHALLGLDEHTGLVWDLQAGECAVTGVGAVTVLAAGKEQVFPTGSRFSIQLLGNCCTWPEASDDITPAAWDLVRAQADALEEVAPPAAITALAEQRQQARARRDWAVADRLRDEIADRGWKVEDTAEGWTLVRA